MDIRKTVITLRVLHPADESLDSCTLEEIGRECDHGGWMCAWDTVSDELVPPENVKAEEEALGGDGTFFGEDESDDD